MSDDIKGDPQEDAGEDTVDFGTGRDDLGLEDLDIPVPPTVQNADEVEDQFDYDTAFKIAFVGVGQGGSRIAESFYKIGYRRVAAINTTLQDLNAITIPDRNKLDIGGGGAGKDPAVAAAAIADKDEDVYDVLKRSWGRDADYVIVCLGAGGGTGSGATPKVIEVARRLMEESGKPVRVGVIVALPKNSEGQKPAKNALYTIKALAGMDLSPAIILDNERIRELYDPVPAKEYPLSNSSIAKYLHLFNRLAAQDSEHTTFDRADLTHLLDGGVVAFGAQKITEWNDASDISSAIRQHLRKNILASVDLTTGREAGLIFVMGRDVYDVVRSSTIDHGFEMLNRILADGSTVYRGVYPSGSTGLTALTLIASLRWPEERLLELAKVAGVDGGDVQNWLGV
jgi:cell division GTPase FtsZ